MLEMVSFNPKCSGRLSFDQFVPISFRVPPYPRPDPIIWRTGDLQRNLFEIQIDSSTGEVCSATLIIFAGKFEPYDSASHSNVESTCGLPIIDLSKLSGGLVDEVHELVLNKQASELWLFFGSVQSPTRLLKCGRTHFLFCKKKLIGMGFTELNAQETALLGESIGGSTE